MAVAVKRSLAISGGALKRQWHVDGIQIIDGIEFIELSSRDRGFVAFVTGKTTDERCSKYLAELRSLRTEATFKSMLQEEQGAAEALFGEAPAGAETRRSLKRQRASGHAARERGDLPNVVAITAPHGAGNINVLPAIDRGSNVWVEATAATLSKIRDAVLSLQIDGNEEEKITTPKHVWWRSDRQCFVARSSDNRSKTFKPDGTDPASMAAAAQKAATWAGE